MGFDDMAFEAGLKLLEAVENYDYSKEHKVTTIQALTYLILIDIETETFGIKEARREATRRWSEAYAKIRISQ